LFAKNLKLFKLEFEKIKSLAPEKKNIDEQIKKTEAKGSLLFYTHQISNIQENEWKEYFEFSQKYLSTLKNGESFNIINFWKNDKSFPTFKKLARKYLAIPASSSTSERFFSKSVLLFEKKRNRLGIGLASAILFLHHNKI